MAGSDGDLITSAQTYLDGNSQPTFIRNGGNVNRRRSMDWTSSAIRNNGTEIRNEWKRGEKQVMLIPWTRGESIAFEFQKCRCAECIKCGTEAEKETAVDRTVTRIQNNRVRRFFPAAEVNQAVSTQIENTDLPLRRTDGHGYEPRNVCDWFPRETSASQDKNYGYTGYRTYSQNVNGREAMVRLLNPARSAKSKPVATSQPSSTLVRDAVKDEVIKEYVRCFENSFSNAIGREQRERIVENAGASITNATARLTRNGIVYSEARKHPRGIVVTNTTSTYLTKNSVAPYEPASAQTDESRFLCNGVDSEICHQRWGGSNPLRMRREVETKPTSQKNYIQNAVEKFGCNRCKSFALKRPINQRSDHRFDDRAEVGVKENVFLRAKTADVPNMGLYAEVFRNTMGGLQKAKSDHKGGVEEAKKPDVVIQRTMSQSGFKQTSCHKQLQSWKTKRQRRTTNSPCAEKEKGGPNPESCPDSAAEQTTPHSSDRNTNVKVHTCSLLNSKTNIGQEEELAREASKRLENSVGVKHTEETSPNPEGAIPSSIFDESRARDERIRHMKMLQREQEQALDNLLIKRPKCFENEFAYDLENEYVGAQGALRSLQQKSTQCSNQSKNGKDFLSKKTDRKTRELIRNNTQSSGLNQVKEGRTAKCKSPKKRWLKIWKTNDRFSGKKTKKNMTRNIIKKTGKEASSTDENQNLSTDEYTALMGLVNLSKG